MGVKDDFSEIVISKLFPEGLRNSQPCDKPPARVNTWGTIENKKEDGN